MNPDLVIGKSGVHFRDVVLWHVAGDTGGFLAGAASRTRVIVTWFGSSRGSMAAQALLVVG